MYKKLFVTLTTLVLATSIMHGQINKVPSSNNKTWYSQGVFYEMFIRSFKDSDGDRHGDFQGVIDKMDYLDELGVSALWLMPINDSAERTNNYDPINYMDVDPTYGTLEKFKELLDEAHKKGIRVILDFVLNHTSDKHPFFLDAVKNPNSKYRDWYVFSETKPTGSWAQYWKKCETGWYYAYFVGSKPDLNFKNPKVIAYFKEVMKFWIDMGVDGFRFDAVTLLVENGDGKLKNQPESYEIYRDFRNFLDNTYPEREIFTVAESEPPYNSYLGNGNDMFNAVFNFRFNTTVIRTVKNATPFTKSGASMLESIVTSYIKDLKDKEGGFYATLLSNHDSYAGLRPFRQFDGNLGKTKLAGSILLTMPGIPFVYYGEEIAMDTYTGSKSDRWLRNCMIWDDSENSGFTTGKNGWTMINGNDDAVNKLVNVAKQQKDPDSILNLYKQMIRLRKENTAIALGDFITVDAKSSYVQAVIRTYENQKLLIAYNFSEKAQNAKITLSPIEAVSLKELTNYGAKAKISKNIVQITRIAPYQTLIFALE